MFKEAFYKIWFPWILERRCPGEIPRSGDKGKKVNCFSLALDDGGEPYLLVESYGDGRIEAARWDGKRYSEKVTLAVEDVLHKELRITHYYGLASIVYSSIYDFSFHRYTGWQYLKVHAYWSTQKLGLFAFNHKKLLTKKRMELLRLLIEKHLERRHKGIDSMGLMTELYSIKWVLHPRSTYQHEKVKLYLESLEVSGEVKKVNEKYVVTGKGISSLEKFEEEERRHRQSARIQMWIAFLTLLIALFGLEQTEIINVPTMLDFGNGQEK